MSYKDTAVDVSVSLGTSQIEQLGFDTPVFITPTNVFTGRVQAYSDLDSIVSAGFAVGSPVHRFAENVFAGKFRPDIVKVGRLAYTGTTVTYNQASYSGILTLNITVKTNTSSFVKVVSTASLPAASTPAQAATAVAAAIEADTDIGTLVTAAASTNVVTVAPTASEVVSIGYSMEGQYVISNTSSESVAVGLPLINAVDSNWYFLSTESHTDADIKAAAAYAASAEPKRMHIYSTSDVDTKNPALTTDILSELKALAYDTSIGFYHPDADEDWSEGGIVGACASIDPSFGDSLHLKTMPSIKVYSTSVTDRETVWNKNGNIYRTVKGQNVIWEGKVASGQYFDTIRFSHWFAAKLSESTFGYLYRRSNLGQSMKMSDQDLPVLRSIWLNDPINPAIRNGGILDGFSSDGKTDYSPIIVIPPRNQIPTNDLAARFLDNCRIEVVYNNSLHFIKIRAFVELDRITA